jgi:tetratricopeptide (TPR) repeat protein
MHGQHQELISCLEVALATAGTIDMRTRAVGQRTLGDALIFIEQENRARVALDESLALFRELGDELGEASVLLMLAVLFDNPRSSDQAIALSQRALAIGRQQGDKSTVARAVHMLACSLLNTGELERSRTTFEESLAIYIELGDHGAAASSAGALADLALVQGDHQQAERRNREALDLIGGFGNEREEMYCVAGGACVAALRGDAHTAGRLWAIAEAAENRLGMRRMVAVERARYERIITPLENDRAFQAGYQAGRDIDLADAVRELRAP